MQTPMPTWVYTQPETGYVVKSIVYNDLLNRVRLHRLANGIPCNPGWEQTFEDELCKQMKLSDRWCVSQNGSRPRKPGVNFADVTNFLGVLAAWMPTRKWVDQAEAERRAEICAACPHNVEVAGCSVCSNIVGKITGFLGNRATSKDAKLKGCNVCGCSNRAQVHVPLEVLQKGVTPEMEFPAECWKREAYSPK